MTLKQWVAFILLAIVWGSSYLWIKIAVGEMGPFTLVAFRLLFGAIFLIGLVLIRRPEFPKQKSAWASMAFVGMVNTAIPFTFISWGEIYIDSAMASILIGAVPLFTLFIAHWTLKDDRMTAMKLLGLVTGFIGIFVLMSESLIGGSSQNSLLGQLAMLGAAASYAIGITFARRRLSGVSHSVQALVCVLFADAVIWAAALGFEAPIQLPQSSLAWWAVLILGFLGTGLAYRLFFYLIQSAGATKASMVTYVAPVVGVILGVTFLNEALTWQLIVGTILVVGAVLVVNRAPAAKNFEANIRDTVKEIFMDKINIAEKFSQFDTHWDPKVIGELNGQHVKIAKLKGEFVWHQHEHEDELFLVIKGKLLVKFRDKGIELNEGEMLIIPKGVEHLPIAEEEVHLLMFEPVGTLNTGNAQGDARTVVKLEKI